MSHLYHGYVKWPEGKSPFSYGFPMVFLWFSYGFPMVFLYQMGSNGSNGCVFFRRFRCPRSWIPGGTSAVSSAQGRGSSVPLHPPPGTDKQKLHLKWVNCFHLCLLWIRRWFKTSFVGSIYVYNIYIYTIYTVIWYHIISYNNII